MQRSPEFTLWLCLHQGHANVAGLLLGHSPVIGDRIAHNDHVP
jgi:hypothetical protein